MNVTGELVRDTRLARKQSRKAVAAETGLTEAKIWNIERGRALTTDETERLLTWLGEIEDNEPTFRPVPDDVQPSEFGGISPGVDVPPVESVVDVAAAVEPAAADEPPVASTDVSDAERLLARTDDGVRLFSNSELQTFKRCRRKWWLGWHRGLRLAVESPVGPRAVGDRGHRALAQWYVPAGTPRTDPRDALERLITSDWSALVEHHGTVPPELEKKFVADADLERIMLAGYLEWLAESGDDADLDVVAPEAVLARPLGVTPTDGRELFFIGRLDARLVRRSDGSRQFMDHKFVAEFTSPTRVLPLDEQMLGYHLLEWENLAETEPRSVGALYNMLRRVRRTTSARPPFYLRVFVGHNVHELESYRLRANATVRLILEAERALTARPDRHLEAAFPTPTRNCAWDCPFFAVCPLFDDGSRVEDMIKSYYVEGDPRDYYRREVTGETRNEE